VPVPILLVAGFLGAGKTTVVNYILAHAEGRRIAAVVNDFGAVNIDAELIAGAADGIVSLANGCICCSLEGDLLRTLAAILRRSPRPEAIVIETSGVADPTDIVRNLMDPVIWREAPLETVLCVVDATAPVEALNDALLRSQLRAADLVALSKVDLVDAAGRERIRDAVAAIRPAAVLVDALHGQVPLELLFLDEPDRPPAPRDPGRRRPVSDRFETFSWTSHQTVSLPRLQRAIGHLAPKLARARACSRQRSSPAASFCSSSPAAARRWPRLVCLRPGRRGRESCSSLRSAFFRLLKSTESWTAVSVPVRGARRTTWRPHCAVSIP
jgi:G3E family GTPase